MKLSLILITMCVSCFAREVQNHGLLFEKWLRDTFFGGYEPESYTQKWDIPASANPNHGGIPVNPKAAKIGTPIGFGDALRQFDIDESFLLIVGFWEQVSPLEKHWTNVQAVTVEPEIWSKLWHPVTRRDLEKLDALIKDKSLSLEEAREAAKVLKAQAPFSEAVFQVNPKIDASQRRLQCSLRFDDFFRHLASGASPASQTSPSVFGVPVPARFESGSRKLTPH